MPPSGANWQLVFHDGFDGVALDASKWLAVDGSASDGIGTFRAANVGVSNGELVLRVDSNYDSARIRSWLSGVTRRWVYGWYEFEAKIDAQVGSWSGLWLWHSAQDPHYYEIDVEPRGTYPTTNSYGHIYQTTPSVLQDRADISETWGDGQYHVWAIHWTPSFVRWYRDGVLVREVTTNIQHVPCEILLDHKVGGSFAGSPDDTTIFPYYMRVRNVQAWQDTTWHGYVRVQYSPQTLDGAQRSQVTAALRELGCKNPIYPHLDAQVYERATHDWLCEFSLPEAPTSTTIAQAVSNALAADSGASLTVTVYVGADWVARRLAAKTALGL